MYENNDIEVNGESSLPQNAKVVRARVRVRNAPQTQESEFSFHDADNNRNGERDIVARPVERQEEPVADSFAGFGGFKQAENPVNVNTTSANNNEYSTYEFGNSLHDDLPVSSALFTTDTDEHDSVFDDAYANIQAPISPDSIPSLEDSDISSDQIFSFTDDVNAFGDDDIFTVNDTFGGYPNPEENNSSDSESPLYFDADYQTQDISEPVADPFSDAPRMITPAQEMPRVQNEGEAGLAFSPRKPVNYSFRKPIQQQGDGALTRLDKYGSFPDMPAPVMNVSTHNSSNTENNAEAESMQPIQDEQQWASIDIDNMDSEMFPQQINPQEQAVRYEEGGYNESSSTFNVPDYMKEEDPIPLPEDDVEVSKPVKKNDTKKKANTSFDLFDSKNSKKGFAYIRVLLIIIIILAVFSFVYVIALHVDKNNQQSGEEELTVVPALRTQTIEIGDTVPTDVSMYVEDDYDSASFVTDISTIDNTVAGDYDIELNVNGVQCVTKLVIVDTVAPALTLHNVQIVRGAECTPADFIDICQDNDPNVTFSFEAVPDCNTLGSSTVTIKAIDTSGNSSTATAELLVSLIEPITAEVSDKAFDLSYFSESFETYEYADADNPFIPSQVGEMTASFILNGENVDTTVNVIDTTAPVLEAGKYNGYLNYPVTAEEVLDASLVTEYSDYTAEFVTEPDWTSGAKQSVDIIVTDISGNSAQVTYDVKLKADTEAPTMIGIKNKSCYVGQAVAYLENVTITDNADPAPTVEVAKDEVNYREAGTYTVTYTAYDKEGNTTSKSCTFTFIEHKVTDEELQSAADAILNEIVTDDMSLNRKAYAVFNYVHDHITYTGTSDKSDWEAEAVRGYKEGTGDCFTYYSLSKLLLEHLGFETLCVTRYGGNKTTQHYWLLVNTDQGWYHFDAINPGPKNFECFMKTDEQVLDRGPNFWSFDRTAYPASSTEAFVRDWEN